MNTFITPIIFTTTLLLHIATASTTNLLHQTCKNSSTNNPKIPYSFCIAALQSAPTSRCADLNRLGVLSLRLLKDNVTDTRCVIKIRLKEEMKMGRAMEEALEDCLELYSDSVYTLNEAFGDYKVGKYFDANVKVSAIMDAVDTCEDGFKDVGVVSPLSRLNKFSFRLSAISLSIMNMIQSRLD